MNKTFYLIFTLLLTVAIISEIAFASQLQDPRLEAVKNMREMAYGVKDFSTVEQATRKLSTCFADAVQSNELPSRSDPEREVAAFADVVGRKCLMETSIHGLATVFEFEKNSGRQASDFELLQIMENSVLLVQKMTRKYISTFGEY